MGKAIPKNYGRFTDQGQEPNIKPFDNKSYEIDKV